MPCASKNVFSKFLIFPKNKVLKKFCGPTSRPSRTDAGERWQCECFRGKVFLYVTASQNGSSRWRIRKSLQFASSCCRRSPSFAEANATIKTRRTLFSPHYYSCLIQWFSSRALDWWRLSLRSGHTTQLPTCHHTLLSCHTVSLIGFCV